MKTAVSNLLFISALAIPLIAIAVASPGPFAERLLPSGIILMTVGLSTSLYFYVKGKKADRDHGDELANYIFEKSAKFTFYVMAVVIQVYWAYNFALAGNEGDFLFILLVIFWCSFLAAIVYNRLKV